MLVDTHSCGCTEGMYRGRIINRAENYECPGRRNIKLKGVEGRNKEFECRSDVRYLLNEFFQVRY